MNANIFTYTFELNFCLVPHKFKLSSWRLELRKVKVDFCEKALTIQIRSAPQSTYPTLTAVSLTSFHFYNAICREFSSSQIFLNTNRGDLALSYN